MEIKAKSAESAFHHVLDVLRYDGIESSPRGMKIKEVLNCCIEIENPRDRIISCQERKISMSYAFGELCWYLSGRNDLRMMKYYSKFMERGTDDGETLNSAYGYRIFTGKHKLIPFDQWENVKRLLKEDKDSRQAIIHLHTPNNKKTNDEVCTLSLQFLVRDGKLNMITTMRSNDVVLGFTYDVFAFTMLQEILANELGLELGKYYHNVGSMHIYENKFYLLEKHTYAQLSPMERFDYKLKDFNLMIHIERFIRNEIVRMKLFESKLTSNDFFNFNKIIRNKMEQEDELLQFATTSFMLKAYKTIDSKEKFNYCNVLLDHMRERNENYADVLQSLVNFSKSGKKIILEGIDGAGKTTYACNIQSKNNYQIQHYCKPSKNFGFYNNYIFNLMNDEDIIFDRFFISELIYSRVAGRTCKINEGMIALLLHECKKKNVKFVFFLAKTDEQLNIVMNRLKPEDLELKTKIERLNKDYIKMAKYLISEKFDVEIKEIQGDVL